MGEKDISEKLLEDYDDVFADIVNVLLFGGDRLVKETELVNLKERSQYKADGALHEQERDVIKLWQNCELRLAVLGIENQTAVDEDMVFRVLGYDGSSYRQQLFNAENKSTKKQRYPVITLVLYFGFTRHWEKHTLYDILAVPEKLRPYVNDYHINVFEIAWLTEEQVALFQSDFKFVADYFVQMRKNRQYIPSEETIHHVDAILKMMAVLTGNKKFEDAQNRTGHKDRKGEVASMRTFLDDAWDEGLEQGLMERLIRQVYKKMLRGQNLAQIAMETEEEEETVREIYDVINRSLPEFDVKKVYLELKEKRMATV